MLQLEEVCADTNKIPFNPPKPDFSHINSNIVVSDPFWVEFDEVYIADEQNGGRQQDGQSGGSGVDVQHLQALGASFSAGVIETEELPAVQRAEHPTDIHLGKKYNLKYGFGRILSLISLGLKGYWVCSIQKMVNGELVDLSKQEWQDVQLYENEPLPRKPNKEANIIYVVATQVRDKMIPNTEEAIREKIEKIFPNRDKVSISRCVKGIMETEETPQKFAYWGDTKIEMWIKNHLADGIPKYQIGGKWDEEREMWGYAAKHGSLSRTYGQAIKKYADTGFPSYVIIHFGNPTPRVPMHKKRELGVQEYVELRKEYVKVYGKDVEVLQVLGAMPQVHGVDEWNRLVELNIPKGKFRVPRKRLSYSPDPVSPIIRNKIDEKLGLLPNNGYNTYDLEKRGLEVADRTGRLRHLKYG